MTRLKRLLCVLTVLLTLCLAVPANAAKPTATPNPNAIVEPTLPPDTNPYDKEHPEDLDQDQLYAYSAILVATANGEVIFEKDPDTIRYPASTTKILTVWLGITMMQENLDFMVTVSDRAVDVPEDGSSMNLKAGEEIRFIDLLYGTMLLSANDGANAIAEAVSGSIESFVDLMNDAAAMMGCTSTHFNNPHGYPDPYHYSTARDMSIIACKVMTNDIFRQIAGTYSYPMPKTNKTRARTITNSNLLLKAPTEESANKYYYEFATGMKTGSSQSSGYCFIGSAEKDGVELISVAMYTGKYSRWTDTTKLFNYGFSQYTSVTPVDLYNMNPITLETSGYALDDANLGKLPLICVPVNRAAATRAKIIATFAQVDAMAANLQDTVFIQYVRDFVAPIEAGETMATMTYFTENGDAIEYNLNASRSIARRANAPKTLSEIIAEVNADPNPFPPLTVELVIYASLPFLALILLFMLLRFLFRKRHRSSSRVPKIGRRYLK